MKTLSVQIQPERIAGVDISLVVKALRKLAQRPDIAAMGTTAKVESGNEYVNVKFKTQNAPALWEEILIYFPKLKSFSTILNGLIIVCEGDKGWGDYLLLYHFSSKEKLDTFAKKP